MVLSQTTDGKCLYTVPSVVLFVKILCKQFFKIRFLNKIYQKALFLQKVVFQFTFYGII